MTKLTFPLRPYHYTKIDTVYCDAFYQQKYKAYHPGIDANGKGGGETDYGYAVVSVYDGIVTDVKIGKDKWGLIVRVWHPALNVFSRYAHLMDPITDTAVVEGQIVTKGQIIGFLGNGYGAWKSHLHFDFMYAVEGIPFDFWVQGLGAENLKRVQQIHPDPMKIFAKFGVE